MFDAVAECRLPLGPPRRPLSGLAGWRDRMSPVEFAEPHGDGGETAASFGMLIAPCDQIGVMLTELLVLVA